MALTKVDAQLLGGAITTDSSGNVGIGTASPPSKLSVQPNASFGLYGSIASASDNYPALRFNDGSNVPSTAHIQAGTLIFDSGASSTERMRIDSSGNLLIGTTGLPQSNGKISVTTSTSNTCLRAYQTGGDGNLAALFDKSSSTNTSSQWFIGFTINAQTTASGVITANGPSQAAFGSWSDKRLKENIVDLQPQLEKICALRPVEFDYISSEGGGHQTSFIAQEFEEVYPDAVGERPDGMKTLTGWGKTEAILVKAIQEQQAIIEDLKTRVTALEAAA